MGQFNFHAEYFIEALPMTCADGDWMELVTDRKNAQQSPEENPENWYILRLILSGKEYPSFIHLRRSGQLKGSLTDALAEFATLRASYNKDVSPHFLEIMRSRFRELATHGDSNAISGYFPENWIGKFVDDISGVTAEQSVHALIEAFLLKLGAPVEKSGSAYSFRVSEPPFVWNCSMETRVRRDELVVTSFSVIQNQASESAGFYEDINALNAGQSFGFFQVDLNQEKILSFRSALPMSTLVQSPEKLGELFRRNMDCMHAGLTVLSGKYPGMLNFS